MKLLTQRTNSGSFFLDVVLVLLPLTLGLGIYPLLLPIIVTTIPFFLLLKNRALSKKLLALMTMRSSALLAALVWIFFLTYWSFYIPYHPHALIMPWGYFPVLLALTMLTWALIECIQTKKMFINFVWYFCLGSLIFCLITIGATSFISDPPVFVKLIDIRYLIFGLKKYINTPGVSNLLSLLPVAFLASFILEEKQRPKWFWFLGAVGFAISLAGAIAIGQRSYFVITFVIEPAIVGAFLLLLKAWRLSLAMLFTLCGLPVLWLLDQLLGTAFLHKFKTNDITQDGRFQMFKFWLEKLIENPFYRTEVGPAAQSDLLWFHNFFADIHRLSGFWALLAAAALVVYIFSRVFCIIKVDRRFGLYLMAIAIPCFLIMNTSVVPEAERQPFLLLLAIGIIADITLTQIRCRSKRGFSIEPTEPNTRDA